MTGFVQRCVPTSAAKLPLSHRLLQSGPRFPSNVRYRWVPWQEHLFTGLWQGKAGANELDLPHFAGTTALHLFSHSRVSNYELPIVQHVVTDEIIYEFHRLVCDFCGFPLQFA